MKIQILAILALTCSAFFAVKAQGTLQFNQVRLISATTETVPTGKVWKIVNVYVNQVQRFQASSGSGTCLGGQVCNGGSTRWNSFSVNSCPTASDFQNNAQMRVDGANTFFNVGSPIWLPAGSTVQGNQYTCNNSNGWFDGQGFSCHCPTNQTVFSTVSVIEFNIIP
jgi:hypothetical protein